MAGTPILASSRMAAFVSSRLAPWSKGGHLFGLPLDVHPVSITYRRDLYEQAGVDLELSDGHPAVEVLADRAIARVATEQREVLHEAGLGAELSAVMSSINPSINGRPSGSYDGRFGSLRWPCSAM